MINFKTISEMTEGMNEFQKFSFFSRKEQERVELVRIYWLLYNTGGMDFNGMRKALRISRLNWWNLYYGIMPLPDDLLFKIKRRFKDKIAECEHIESKRRMDKYFDYLRRPFLKSEGSQETDKTTSTEVSADTCETNAISSPEKTIA